MKMAVPTLTITFPREIVPSTLFHFRVKREPESYASATYINSHAMSLSTQYLERSIFDYCINVVLRCISSRPEYIAVESHEKRLDSNRFCLMIYAGKVLNEQIVQDFCVFILNFFSFLQEKMGVEPIVQMFEEKYLSADILTAEEIYAELPSTKHRYTVGSVRKLPVHERVNIVNAYRKNHKLTSTAISKLNDFARYKERRSRERVKRIIDKYKKYPCPACHLCDISGPNLHGDVYWGCFSCKLAYHKSCYESEIYTDGIWNTCACTRNINPNYRRQVKLNNADDKCCICLLGEISVTGRMLTSHVLYHGCSVCKMLIHYSCYNELKIRGRDKSCIYCRNAAPISVRRVL